MNSSFFRCLIFTILLLGVCLLWGYQNILFYRPQSIHQWAQCDRASVAFNYYMNGFHFFKPQVHNISNGSGITGLEFPIINFLAAIGYALFGFHEYIYRLIVFLCLLSGLINAYRLANLLLSNSIVAALPVYLLFASPVLAYYGITFLADPVSLGLALSGWYYFFRWQENKKARTLITTIVFCSLASMIKISSLINPLAMAAFVFLNADGKTFAMIKVRVQQALPFLIVIIPVLAWYFYASWLNKTYESKVFMLEMRPVSSWEEFITIWKEIEQTWLWRFYPKIYFIALLIGSVSIAALPQKINKPLLTITLLLYVGAISFFLLMFTQFRIHDYYIIPLMPAFFFHWLLIIKQFSLIQLIWVKRLSALLFLSLVCFVITEAKDHLTFVYAKSSWQYSPLVYDRYFFLEPELRKLNIQPEDPVISIFDLSFNVTLYLMNQRGFTVGPLTPQKEIIKELQNPLYKYAILNNFNPSRFDPVMDSLNLGKKILDWNDLTVYQLPIKK